MTTGQDAPARPRPQTFRSPFAVAIWWLWVLFAVGNLIDLAVQGHDHRARMIGNPMAQRQPQPVPRHQRIGLDGGCRV